MNCQKCGAEILPDDKFCSNCGQEIEPRYCQNCGSPITGRFCARCGTDYKTSKPTTENSKTTTLIQKPWYPPGSHLKCPRCHSTNIDSSVFSQPQKTGCVLVIIYIILAITLVGWLVLIPLIARNNKSKTVTAFVCKNCGYSWKR